MVRADFLVDENGRFWLGELNTIPGFTSASMYPARLRSRRDTAERVDRPTRRPGHRASQQRRRGPRFTRSRGASVSNMHIDDEQQQPQTEQSPSPDDVVVRPVPPGRRRAFLTRLASASAARARAPFRIRWPLLAFASLVLAIAALGAALAILNSPLLDISRVEVEGAHVVSAASVKTACRPEGTTRAVGRTWMQRANGFARFRWSRKSRSAGTGQTASKSS